MATAASSTSTALAGTAGRYLSKQLSSVFRLSPELSAGSTLDIANADDLGPWEVRSVQKALRKTEKAVKKEQLALLRPKYHRSMKVDPLSTTSYRMSAKRAIQNVLKESNYAT
eukprot:CAMPEP_0177763110 /NCGR_PEP_ID=MMETSP0491_2-20121128/6697_1 /TAXON_ID=63592 /ORGANISM="Tetraselmis chuii, Strain PLY429" /LENGTH=112 /DNA_ID=CAMNT_0019279197 /DNA_START=449 /DNA_END=787 /DNA_ORIENTATION=-